MTAAISTTAWPPGLRPNMGNARRAWILLNAAEPRDEVKGLVARTTFYMFDRYKLSMSRQQQQLLMTWDKQHPVSAWEKERNRRIAAIMGHSNPFVTGDHQWTQRYKAVGDDVVSAIPVRPSQAQVQSILASANGIAFIIGNRKSQLYHLCVGCPSYGQVSEKTRSPSRQNLRLRRQDIERQVTANSYCLLIIGLAKQG
ncbi:deoxyribonuclease I [Pseudomonas fluorescens]|uniref:Deoxyribonuclease I n=1 Tax=Pseudomonas fluorescens TaxID=294 RepID=A0A448DYH6_PSEFL|nr:deoxyribonuclease I [Pseudomonas fluorescens]